MPRLVASPISLRSSGTLRGPFSALACVVTEVSGGGALVAVEGRLPSPPLTLSFTIAGHALELPVEVGRAPVDGGIIVRFVLPATEHFHRLMAAERQLAASVEPLHDVAPRAA